MAEDEIYDIEYSKWIPVKFRPLTDEEQKEYPDYCYMADCPMPDDGEEILVSTKHGSVEKDECGFDDGYYLDSGYDWQTDIVAWRPLPKPYEPQESEGQAIYLMGVEKDIQEIIQEKTQRTLERMVEE